MSTVFETAYKILAILITFGLAVFVHESGHMLFALIRGVGVESFALGMGPIIGWTWRGKKVQVCWKWRGIDFSLRWLPLGGFVKLINPNHVPEIPAAESDPAQNQADSADASKMSGPKEQSLAESSYDDLYALSDKDTLTKLLVFGGGVFMNFVTAILAAALLLTIGEKVPLSKFTAEKVQPGSELAAAGLRDGDEVTAMNNRPVAYFEDFLKAIDDEFSAYQKADAARIDFALTVKRGGGMADVKFHDITPEHFQNIFSSSSLVLLVPPVIGDVIPSTPAWRAGIHAGDRVLAVNGTPVDSFDSMATIIRANADAPCSVTLQRGDAKLTVQVTPMVNVLEGKQGVIGVSAQQETRIEREGSPLLALARAPGATWGRLKLLAESQLKFLQRASLKQVGQNLGGPITIFVITAHNAGLGFREALNWFINLNLLLIIMNILPIPVLDGGFILLALIEAVIRRPVPPRILGPIYTTFVVFFICLIVAISFLDISKFL